MLQFKEGEMSDDNVEALKSFHRLNVLVFKNDENSTVNQKNEVETIENIISNGKFKELMSMQVKGKSGIISYSGEDNNIEEIVGFGESEEGFMLVRITGEKMTVKQLAKLVSSIDFDKTNLDDLKNIDWD